MVKVEEVTSDDEVDQPDTIKIQLGFSEPPEDPSVIAHRSVRWWTDWDGGQLGGRPTWLQPKDLPKALSCSHCNGTMQFLCQLYVPLDNVPHAFHRSFYLFGCPKCCSADNRTGKGIRVLRTQLPQDNPFWPPEHSDEGTTTTWKNHLPSTWNVHLCQVCGQKATGKCPLQKVWFCGKVHQKEYKRYAGKHKNINNQTAEEDDEVVEATLVQEENDAKQPANETATPSFLPSVYQETELLVDEEPAAGKDDDDDDDDDDDNDEDDEEIEQRPTLFPTTTDDGDGHDSDEDLEQEDLNEMLTGTKFDQTTSKDPLTNAFYRRIQSRKGVAEQCLRYSMDWRNRYDGDNHHSTTSPDEPLWMRSDHQPTEIPPCPYCRAPRAFEFQLMPQMLHFLHHPKQTATNNNQEMSEQAKKNETAKQALIAANSILANSDPTQIPPSFADAKAKAMEVLQQDLFQQDTTRVEWGVVVIYTCTKSCNGGDSVDESLGAYKEEFAWLQPALDGM